MGLPPQTLLGDIVPKPLLRFAAVLSSLACMYRVAIHEGMFSDGRILPRPFLRFAAVLTGLTRSYQAKNTDISRIKRRICARRFPKGDRKALWWGDGAKPHIPKCLDICLLKCSV